MLRQYQQGRLEGFLALLAETLVEPPESLMEPTEFAVALLYSR